MKRVLVIALAIVCGWICFAKKPTKRELRKAEMEAKIDSLRNERIKELEREKSRIVYFDTIKIDSLTDIPIYYDYGRRMNMPKIHYENPVHYIQFAFDDTDKTKYYCATGNGESSLYSEAKHIALEDAVMKIREETGEGVALDSAELLMIEEDQFSVRLMERLKIHAEEEGDTTMLNTLKDSDNVRKVVVAIRIHKPNK